MERRGKKEFVNLPLQWPVTRVFYGSLVMETSSPWVSTVTVATRHQFIRAWKGSE